MLSKSTLCVCVCVCVCEKRTLSQHAIVIVIRYYCVIGASSPHPANCASARFPNDHGRNPLNNVITTLSLTLTRAMSPLCGDEPPLRRTAADRYLFGDLHTDRPSPTHGSPNDYYRTPSVVPVAVASVSTCTYRTRNTHITPGALNTSPFSEHTHTHTSLLRLSCATGKKWGGEDRKIKKWIRKFGDFSIVFFIYFFFTWNSPLLSPFSAHAPMSRSVKHIGLYPDTTTTMLRHVQASWIKEKCWNWSKTPVNWRNTLQLC